jgi:WD40 repeat protein
MPDGKTLITKSARGIIRLWEASTGKLLHTFPQSWENNSPSYAPSPDGATLTAGHEDGLIHWDVATGKRRAKLSAQPRGVINGVAYSPDGELLAVSTHQSLHILNAKTGKELHALNGLKVRSLYIFCFTPDGKRLAAAGDDTTIRLLDVGTGEDLFPKEGYSAPTHGLRFAPDGHALLTLATSDPLLLWDLEQTRLSQAYSGDSWEMTDAHFSGDGRAIIAGDRRGIIYFWSKADGKEIRRLSLSLDTKTPFHERREFDEVTQMALSPNGRLLTVLGRHSRTVPGARAVDSTQVVRWDLATGNELFRREEPNRFPLWRLSPDGRLRASFNTKERTRIVDNETGRSCSILKGNYEYLWPVEFSPDGRLLAGFSRFGIENPIVVAVWEVATGKEVRRFTSAMKGLRCNLAFSSDGRLLAAGAQQEAGMHIWDLATGKEKAVLKGLETEVTCVAFSIDGNRLASGSTSGAVLVWEARPGPQESPPKKHLGENDLQRLLTLLAGDQADKSLEAAWELVGGEEQTVAYLKARLKPAELGSSERLNKLICDLDSAQFAVRDAATKELAKHGTDAEASLRKALERKPSAEVAQRIQSLLNAPSLFALPSHRIQELRMLEVLERIGIPDARQLLEKLSTGTPDARLTQEAKASLERLARRQGQRP